MVTENTSIRVKRPFHSYLYNLKSPFRKHLIAAKEPLFKQVNTANNTANMQMRTVTLGLGIYSVKHQLY